MAVSIAHSKTSLIADGADTSLIRPSDWNEGHIVSGLGGAAELNVGTTPGTVAAGDDARFLTVGTGAGTVTAGDDFRLHPSQFIQVAKNATVIAGQWYTSVKDACDYAATIALTGNRVTIYVHPGEYTESPFTVPAYTYVTGSEDWGGANLITNNNAAHFITMAANSGLMRFRVTGPTGVGFASIDQQASGVAKTYWINMAAGYYGWWAHAASGTARLHCIGCVSDSSTTTNTMFRATAGANIMMMQSGPMAGSGITYGAYADGATASLTFDLCMFRISGHTSVYVDNGASAKGISCTFAQGATALHHGPNGGTITMHGCNVKAGGYTTDVNIAGNTGSFTYSGALTKSKITKTGSITPIIAFADPNATTPGQYIYGELMLGSVTAQTPVTSWINANRATGVVSGGTVQRNSGLNVDVSAGSGFFDTASGQIIVSWGATTVAFTGSSEEEWVQVSNTGVVSTTTVEPDFDTTVVLATANTNSTDVMFLASQQVLLPQQPAKLHEFLTHAVGPVVTAGLAVTKNTSPSLQLDVASGEYMVGLDEHYPGGGAAITWTYWYSDGLGGWTSSAGISSVDTATYDAGTGTPAAMTAGYYRRDLLFIAENAAGFEYHMVLGQQFDSQANAVTNPVAPDFLLEYAVRLAAPIVQQGATDIAEVVDQRTKVGQFIPPTQNTDRYIQIAAGGQTAQFGRTVLFGDANNVSFGLSTGTNINTVTATVAKQTANMSLSGNYVGNSTLSNTGGFVIEGGNNVTLSGTGNTVIVSAANPGGGGQFSAGVSSAGNSAGATGITGTQLVFAGGANITLSQTTGANGGTVTIIGGAGGAGAALKGSGTYTQNTGTIEFANSNGITFGLSNNGTMTASHDGITSQSVQTQNMVSILGSTGNISFDNGNNVTFGGNASTITASIPSGATRTGNLGGIGADTQTATTGTVIFQSGNNVTFGLNNNTITASIPAGATATGNIGSIVGSNATYTSGAVTFTGSNAVTVRSTTGQQIVIDAPVQTVQTQGMVSINGATGNIQFSNSNNVSFGINGSTVTATATFAQSVQTQNLIQAVSGSNSTGGATNTSNAGLQLAQANGFSFILSGNTVSGSVNTTYAASNHSHGANALTGPVAATSASNGFSLNVNAIGNTTAQSNVTWTVGTNGLSLDGRNYAGTGTTFGGTNISGSITQNSNGIALSLSAGAGGGGIVVATNNTGGGTSTVTGSVTFGALNGLTFYQSNGSVVGSYTDAGAGGGISAVVFSAGAGNSNLSNVNFSNSNGVSWGIAGSTITASVNAPATISSFAPSWVVSGMATNTSLGQSTLYFMPIDIPAPLYASRVNFYVSFSGALSAGNSTGSCTARLGYGLYSLNSHSLSLITSYEAIVLSQTMNSNTQYVANHYFGISNVTSHSTLQTSISATNASTYQATNINGQRVIALPINSTLTPGRYWLGMSNQTNAGNAMTNNMSVMVTSVGVQPSVNYLGAASAATNASVFRMMQGMGTYSAQSAAWPSTIAYTTDAIRAPVSQTLVHFQIVGQSFSSNYL